MQVSIVGISQDFSFEDGEAVNYLVVRLPNGNIIRSLIDEETVQIVVEQHKLLDKEPVQNDPGEAPDGPQFHHEEPVARAPFHVDPDSMPPFQGTRPEGEVLIQNPPVSVDDDGHVVFGGGANEEPVDQQELQRSLDQAQKQVAKPSPPSTEFNENDIAAVADDLRGKTQMPVPDWNNSRRTVTKDQMGNPVITGDNVVDPGELVGGDNVDEDGVGSV